MKVLFLAITVIAFASIGCGQSNPPATPQVKTDSIHSIYIESDTTQKYSGPVIVDMTTQPNSFVIGYYTDNLFAVRCNPTGFCRDSVQISVIDSLLAKYSKDSIVLCIVLMRKLAKPENAGFTWFCDHLKTLDHDGFLVGDCEKIGPFCTDN